MTRVRSLLPLNGWNTFYRVAGFICSGSPDGKDAAMTKVGGVSSATAARAQLA